MRSHRRHNAIFFRRSSPASGKTIEDLVESDSAGATRRQRARGRRKILKVVKRSALRKARSVPLFGARRNSRRASRHSLILGSTSSSRSPQQRNESARGRERTPTLHLARPDWSMFDERKWNRQHSLRWKSARWSSSSRRMVGIWIERAVATGNTGMIRKKVWSLLRESPATILRQARKIVSLNKQD